jgi:lipoprotein-anchoring transpeptidase ErfK/SrfK
MDDVGRRAARLVVPFLAALVACGGRDDGAFPPGDREADYAAVDLAAARPPEPATEVGPSAGVDPVPDVGSVVAEATGPRIPIFRYRGDREPWVTLQNPGPFDTAPVFLVRARRHDWIQAMLPMEPNGSKGWIRERDVRLSEHTFRVEVDLGERRLTAYRSDRLFLRRPVAVGTSSTPTPTGLFFTTQLVRPDDPSGPYGPFAYGLSAYSEVLDTFAGGDGQVAIHGTNNPWSIGQAASNGCIRLPNPAIRRLARVLPLGTPVHVEP